MNSHTPRWDGQLFWAHVPGVVCMPVPEYGPACTMILSRDPPPKMRTLFLGSPHIGMCCNAAKPYTGKGRLHQSLLNFSQLGTTQIFPAGKMAATLISPSKFPISSHTMPNTILQIFPRQVHHVFHFSCPKPHAPKSKTSKPQTPQF